VVDRQPFLVLLTDAHKPVMCSVHDERVNSVQKSPTCSSTCRVDCDFDTGDFEQKSSHKKRHSPRFTKTAFRESHDSKPNAPDVVSREDLLLPLRPLALAVDVRKARIDEGLVEHDLVGGAIPDHRLEPVHDAAVPLVAFPFQPRSVFERVFYGPGWLDLVNPFP
jgi:hypothetical protein